MEHTGGITTLLTDSIEQSPSSEANIVLASQEIPHILWNPKVHSRPIIDKYQHMHFFTFNTVLV